MTIFMKEGNTFQVTDEQNLDIHHTLPVGAYTIKFNERSGQFYFEQIDEFSLTGKIYGNTEELCSRILSTFYDRPSATGVLLTGEKGSGKTMLAKMLSIAARKDNIVTVVVNQPWRGEQFNTFIQSIEQPAVFIFDEFEKVYAKELQEPILTLLDGTYSSKKMFIMTCNDKWELNKNMLNRPGRFFYSLVYDGLGADFVEEYCLDNLNNKSEIPIILRYVSTFKAFNFDMLKAIVEEMNRYSESLVDVLKVLNVSSEGSKFKFDIVSFVSIDGSLSLNPNSKPNNGDYIDPLTQQWHVYMTKNNKTKTANTASATANDSVLGLTVLDDDDDEDDVYIHFYPKDIVSFTPEIISYKNECGTIQIRRERERTYKYTDLL